MCDRQRKWVAGFVIDADCVIRSRTLLSVYTNRFRYHYFITYFCLLSLEKGVWSEITSHMQFLSNDLIFYYEIF